MQQYFKVSPPSVHQMVVKLESLGLIERKPGVGRSIRVLIDPNDSASNMMTSFSTDSDHSYFTYVDIRKLADRELASLLTLKFYQDAQCVPIDFPGDQRQVGLPGLSHQSLLIFASPNVTGKMNVQRTETHFF